MPRITCCADGVRKGGARSAHLVASGAAEGGVVAGDGRAVPREPPTEHVPLAVRRLGVRAAVVNDDVRDYLRTFSSFKSGYQS